MRCSAGVGRTGAFIVIDSMLERIRHEKTVDIYGHVTCLRAQRNYMVQTEDQYVFIHDAVQEAVLCGNTEIPARNLYSHIQRLTDRATADSVSPMEREFRVINKFFLHYCPRKRRQQYCFQHRRCFFSVNTIIHELLHLT